MHINLIWAEAKKHVIGNKGAIPWQLPEDLAHFKELTLGNPVIMGRKTWDSLPGKFRPLPGRVNIVITRQPDWRAFGAEVTGSLADALQICSHMTDKPKEVWIIGGAQIYNEALPLAHRVEMTRIDEKFEGDAFAPFLGEEWIEKQRLIRRSKTGMMYSFATFVKDQNSAKTIAT